MHANKEPKSVPRTTKFVFTRRARNVPISSRKRIQDYFRPYIVNADLSGKYDWRSIPRSARYVVQCLRPVPDIACVHAEFVFQLFERYNCTDRALIESWLSLYCRIKMCDYGYDQITYFFSPVRREEYHHSKHMSDSIRVPFYEAHLRDFTIESLLLRPFLLQDTDVLKRLIRYGGIRRDCLDDVNLYVYMLDVFRRLYVKNDPSARDLLFCNQHSTGLPACKSENRLKFVLLAMDAIIQKRHRDRFFANSIKSLKLVFEAVPEPLVTVKEINVVLAYLYSCKDQAKIIDSFSKNFLEEFPRGKIQYQPRSLKHLCRCSIRMQLTECKALPFGVRGLDMPQTLKNYLLLQKDEMEYKPYFRRLTFIK